MLACYHRGEETRGDRALGTRPTPWSTGSWDGDPEARGEVGTQGHSPIPACTGTPARLRSSPGSHQHHECTGSDQNIDSWGDGAGLGGAQLLLDAPTLPLPHPHWPASKPHLPVSLLHLCGQVFCLCDLPIKPPLPLDPQPSARCPLLPDPGQGTSTGPHVLLRTDWSS